MECKQKQESMIKKDQCQEWEGALMLQSREKRPYVQVRWEAQKKKHLYIPNLRGKAEA